MNANRILGISVGGGYIMGTLLAMLCAVLSGAINGVPEYQTQIIPGVCRFAGAIKTSMYIAVFVSVALLLTVGRGFAGDFVAGAIAKLRELGTLCSMFAFGSGAFLFYSMLHHPKLVPSFFNVAYVNPKTNIAKSSATYKF